MASSTRPDGEGVTLLEYANLEEAGGERIELMRGRLLREPAPGGIHGVVLLELLHALHAHVRAHALGRVLVETGVRYPGEPPTVRRPDIAFIAADRLPPSPPASFWSAVPDLVIEIVSPNDRWTAIQEKLQTDLDAGVRAVWIVDPRVRTLTIHRSAAAPRVFHSDDTLDAGDIVDGFTLRVGELFAGLAG
jgi:Uma2 family endonuclease